MVSFQTTKSPDIVGCKLEGQICNKKASEVILKIREAAEHQGKIKVFTRIESIDGFENLGAFMSDFRQDRELLSKVDRYALITNKAYLRAIPNLQDILVPGIAVKAFPLEQKTEAMRWLKGIDVETNAAFEPLKLQTPRIFGLEIKGIPVLDDYLSLNEWFETGFNQLEDLRFYLEFPEVPILKFNQFWDEVTTCFNYLDRFGKVALVSNHSLNTIRYISNSLNPNVEWAHFSLKKQAFAKSWIR